MKKIAFLFFISVSTAAFGQVPDSVYARQHYDKFEYQIPMRDGIKLFTAVYVPKDKSRTYPFLMQRTCYSVAPYGTSKFPRGRLGPSKFLMQDG